MSMLGLCGVRCQLAGGGGGGGQQHLNEVLAAINVPSMTKKSFIHIGKNQAGTSWEK